MFQPITYDVQLFAFIAIERLVFKSLHSNDPKVILKILRSERKA